MTPMQFIQSFFHLFLVFQMCSAARSHEQCTPRPSCGSSTATGDSLPSLTSLHNRRAALLSLMGARLMGMLLVRATTTSHPGDIYFCFETPHLVFSLGVCGVVQQPWTCTWWAHQRRRQQHLDLRHSLWTAGLMQCLLSSMQCQGVDCRFFEWHDDPNTPFLN